MVMVTSELLMFLYTVVYYNYLSRSSMIVDDAILPVQQCEDDFTSAGPLPLGPL